LLRRDGTRLALGGAGRGLALLGQARTFGALMFAGLLLHAARDLAHFAGLASLLLLIGGFLRTGLLLLCGLRRVLNRLLLLGLRLLFRLRGLLRLLPNRRLSGSRCGSLRGLLPRLRILNLLLRLLRLRL